MNWIRKHLEAIIVGIVVAAVAVAGPVVAETVRHALFADKAEFAKNSGKLQGHRANEFVRQSGEILVSTFGPWLTPDSSVNLGIGSTNWTIVSTTGSGSGKFLQLRPDLPTVEFGKSLKIKGVELCYDATPPDVTLSAVSLTRFRNTAGITSSPTTVVANGTDRNDDTCRLYTGTPLLLTADDALVLKVTVDWTDDIDSLILSRTTFVFQATKTAADPIS